MTSSMALIVQLLRSVASVMIYMLKTLNAPIQVILLNFKTTHANDKWAGSLGQTIGRDILSPAL